MISLEISGGLLGAAGNVRAALAEAVAEAAADVEAGAKIAIQTGDKTGHIYKREGKDHQASAPGEAPATDTGNLAGSIQATPVDELTWDVGTNVEYAPVLEMGGVHMQARPFLAPAVEAEREALEEACAKALAKGIG